MNEKIKKVDQDYIKANKDFYDCLMKMDHEKLVVCAMRVADENISLKYAIKYALKFEQFDILRHELEKLGEVEK